MDVKHYFLLTFLSYFVVYGEANDCRTGCYFNETLYLVNEAFNDGCNNCVCTHTGALCGRMYCGKPIKQAEIGCYCETFHPVGRMFKHTDGCNECTCDMNGPVCSRMMCPSNPRSTVQPRSFIVSDCRVGELRCQVGGCVSWEELCLSRPGAVCQLEDYDIYCNSARILSSSITFGLLVTLCGVLLHSF